jgi:predicted DNA-binding transcriptional regulator AlpA
MIPGYIDTRQVAAKMGVRRQTVWNYHNQGLMPQGVKVGPALLWPEKEIDEWLASRRGHGWRKGLKGSIRKHAVKEDRS